MAHGYIEDGEFVNTADKTRATKCDSCGKVVEQEGITSQNGYELVDADALGLEGYSGYANICDECLIGGIGEETVDDLKGTVFTESEDESVEL